MTIEEIEQLEQAATPRPWYRALDEYHNSNIIIMDDAILFSNEGHGSDRPAEDIHLICVLRNLAPELIALWKAMNMVYSLPDVTSINEMLAQSDAEMAHIESIETAIEALNAKAAALPSITQA